MEHQFEDKQILVTGGAGFIGSHLVDRLVAEGGRVTVIDNFITGNRRNLNEVKDQITLIEADVVEWAHELQATGYKLQAPYEYIFHLASPASPRGYMDKPIETYLVNSFGTHYLAMFALNSGARMLFASTSESYGDPLEHPQKETYWGNVNPVGVRSCYDESKRFGEMVMSTLSRNKGLDARIVRIFNTYGPRMDPADGRVFPNFIMQALKNEPITVHGDGQQTRSFCFVSDLVELLLLTMSSENARNEVINIGNPEEHTMLEMAQKIKTITQSHSEIVFVDRPSDDPMKRKPDITKAKKLLGFEPKISLDEGLAQTVAYFKNYVGQ